MDDIADAGKRERANVAALGESIYEGLRRHGEALKDELREERRAHDDRENKGLYTYVHCRRKQVRIYLYDFVLHPKLINGD